MHKISITVDDEVAKALESVPARQVSRFVNAAIRHELERERLRALLGELEEALGPADPLVMREAAAAFARAEAGLASKPQRRRRATRRA